MILQQTTWSFETVKHLAFINGAGLAGAATLYASNSTTKIGSIPSIAFTVGLLLAVLDMHINTLAYQARSREIGKRITEFDQQKRTAEKLFEDVSAGRIGFKVAGAIGTASAISFIVGIVPFVKIAFAP